MPLLMVVGDHTTDLSVSHLCRQHMEPDYSSPSRTDICCLGKVLCYWPLIKNKTRNIMGENELPQNLKNLSDVGRSQVTDPELACASQPSGGTH